VRYFLANWKMYPTVGEAVSLTGAVQAGLRARTDRGDALPLALVCPPFVALLPVREVIDRELVRLGAQNCHWEPEGPYTGEISPRMLAGIVDYVLVGHSERRAMGDADEDIAKKVSAVAEAGLTPILFVGEDEPSDAAARESEERLVRGLARVDTERQEVLVVYEPTWAIGGDEAAEGDHVLRVVEHLKDRLRELGSAQPEVIYGGTVNLENVDRFAAIDALDGVGATRASLDADGFLRLVDRVTAARAPAAE
jgi:triosephosphate isomerase